MAIRAQGKAGFAVLQQNGERLQIYVRMDAVGEQGFQLYKLLDMGDHIGVGKVGQNFGRRHESWWAVAILLGSLVVTAIGMVRHPNDLDKSRDRA